MRDTGNVILVNNKTIVASNNL